MFKDVPFLPLDDRSVSRSLDLANRFELRQFLGWAVSEPKNDKLNRIAVTARPLVRKRDLWLNPPAAEVLKKRTPTNLYSENPSFGSIQRVDFKRRFEESP